MSEDEEENDKFNKEAFNEIHEQIQNYKKDPEKRGMFVSGWDDADVDVDIEKNPQESPAKHLLWAAENGDVTVIEEILNGDPTIISTTDKDGYTPLHRATYGNHLQAITVLLSHGASVSSRTQMGWQPLHSACNWNNYKAAALLLAAGADINALSDGDQTPLHIAASVSQSRATLVILLLSANINPHILNKSDELPQDLAKRRGIYGTLFEMADPTINVIKSESFTDNPYMREEI